MFGADKEISVTRLSVKKIVHSKKVYNLTNSQYQTGNHKIIWKGIDDSGKKVSSGLYFYKMNINGLTTVTRKMLLLK